MPISKKKATVTIALEIEKKRVSFGSWPRRKNQ